MLSCLVIAPTSPREPSRSAPGSLQSSINPVESHPCAIAQDNSPRITSLRKNHPGERSESHSPTASSLTAPSPLESALANVYENKQLQTQQIPHLRKTRGGGSAPCHAISQLSNLQPSAQTSPAHANFSTPLTMPQKLPSLVIVGRPNVGKSTLFNRLTGTRRSIVTNEPGITRDRIYGKAEWRGRNLEIVDTGGIVPDDRALIPQEILRQAHVAISKAALLVLVVDSQAGLTPMDEELARLLRTTGKPFVIAANKVDAVSQENNAGVFHSMGVPVFPIAAEHGTGVDDLLDAALAETENDAEIDNDAAATEDEKSSGPVEVAIIGRPNV